VVGALIHPASGPTEICNVVVGKGLVYDTGGVQDKGEHMPGMQGDMQGSAAVLAQALYFQNYPERLRKSTLFVMVLAENRDGPSAYLPNNIYPMYNGTTVEVTHTDAEGRLVLADAVGWATELVATSSDRGIKIGTVCTIATLTGAAVNALGPPYSGVMVKDNDPELTARLVLSGNRTGDLVWPLPDHPWYAAKMKSHAADLRNTGTIKQGGAQQGFAFLKRAPSGDVQGLVHLDIAPKLEGSGEDGYTDGLPRDGAVAMMIDFLSAS
jgi:leucyl aminopeptidase